MKVENKSIITPRKKAIDNKWWYIAPWQIFSDIKKIWSKILSKIQDSNIPKAKAMYEDLVKKWVSPLDAQTQIVEKYGRNAWKGSKAGSIWTKESDLISEAKKYKSADEFVKSKWKPLYHWTNANFKEFDANKFWKWEWASWWWDWVYLSDNINDAKKYWVDLVNSKWWQSNVMKVIINKDSNIMDVSKWMTEKQTKEIIKWLNKYSNRPIQNEYKESLTVDEIFNNLNKKTLLSDWLDFKNPWKIIKSILNMYCGIHPPSLLNILSVIAVVPI